MFAQDGNRWVEDTFGSCELGDARRRKRLVHIAGALAEHPDSSLNAVFEGQEAGIEDGYRFMRNEEVDPDAILMGGVRASMRAMENSALILAIDDSTTLSYDHSVVSHLGDIGGKKSSRRRGYWVHSTLLVDGQTGQTLGLGGQQWWIRDQPDKRGKAKERRERPYEEKESYKWSESSQRLRALLGTRMSSVISVCDREADIFEYLHDKKEHEERYVVRVTHDRALEEKGEHVWSRVQAATVQGFELVSIEQRGGQFTRKKRAAKLSLRYGQLTLRSPLHGVRKLPALPVWFVHAREEAPPSGEEPLEWLLYTSELVETLEQAKTVLGYYRLRWRIEEFHKAWKSGCGVEDVRMQTANNLRRLAQVLAFVAVRLLQLRDLAQASPEASALTLLETDEWQCLWVSTEKTPLPATVPTAQWAYQALGRLGGWRKNRSGRIGWATLWNGWFKLKLRYEGWKLALAWLRTAPGS